MQARLVAIIFLTGPTPASFAYLRSFKQKILQKKL